MSRQPATTRAGFSRDVVGVGALNIDYLADGAAPARSDPRQPLATRITTLLAAAGGHRSFAAIAHRLIADPPGRPADGPCDELTFCQ